MNRCRSCGREICDDDKKCDYCGAKQGKKQCEVCGKWSYEVNDGVCNDCLIKIATNETAIMIGADDRQDISLNGYLAWQFSTAEIEELLQKELSNAASLYPSRVKEDAKVFCLGEYDKYTDEYENAEWFAKWARNRIAR